MPISSAWLLFSQRLFFLVLRVLPCSPQALLHAAETRTSAPLRLDRHPDTLQSLGLPGLYPCGEGAGYAGGIVSAAVDGLRVGGAVARELTGHVGAGGLDAAAFKVSTQY
jgi:hypothetical protein